ncbi:hypothetical protein ACWEVP_06570 [Amycolatopsis sp. NPDC003865]
MTDLERKLADALRGQAEQVTPNLDAAWAEQQRRQRRPRRRRSTVVVAPLAAVLVVLTSVLLATQLNTPSAPPAQPGVPLTSAEFTPEPMHSLFGLYDRVRLTDFVGQTDPWTAYAFTSGGRGGLTGLLCVASVPAGQQLATGASLYGDGPRCTLAGELPPRGMRAAYLGEPSGPLPPGKAAFFTDSTVRTLRLYAANGDLTLARPVGHLASDLLVFVADVPPGSPPVRFEVS